MGGRMRGRRLACGVAVLAGWLVPGASVAMADGLARLSGTSGTDAGTAGFIYDARFGATNNDVTVTRSADGQSVTITDPGVNIVADPGGVCSGGDGVATCTAPGGLTGGTVDAGDGDDRVSFAGDDMYAFVDGGKGNDTLIGASRLSILSGGEGDDTLRGGEAGDGLQGGPGADDLSGGPGSDDANYSDEQSSVTLSLDDVANDGAPGEGDNIHSDVEMAEAIRFDPVTNDPVDPPGGDTIIGDDDANYLESNNGPAKIEGLGGDDTITVVNATGNQTLDGGAGNDLLDSCCGDDTIIGGDGDDILHSWADHAGGDTVRCDAGNDLAHTNPGDAVDACETVDVKALPPEPNPIVRIPVPTFQCWIYPFMGRLGGPTPAEGPFCP
jgi:Ca2+-binding RTX toxin-like protein